MQAVDLLGLLALKRTNLHEKSAYPHMRYTPPAPEDLRCLKDELQLTGEQMAELFGLAGGQQWRKYTGGQEPRDMSLQMLFFAAARLELDGASIERVLARMRRFGAVVDPLAPVPVQKSREG